MRSIKLLVAMAALAALVSGPVMAQEAAPASSTEMAPAADSSMTTKSTKKHSGKKHSGKKHHKKSSSTMTPAQ